MWYSSVSILSSRCRSMSRKNDYMPLHLYVFFTASVTIFRMLIFMYILCTCVVARNGCRVLRTTTPIPLESISFQRGVTFLCQVVEICRRCLAVSRCSSADLVCSIATLLFCSVVVSSHHANLYLCAFEVRSFLFFRRRFRVSRHCHCCCRRTCLTILMW